MSKTPTFPKAKGPWFALKNVSDEQADIYFYDVIGDSWLGSDAATVVKEIKGLKAKKLNVHINSPGGSVFDGIAIYNALISHNSTVTVYVDSLAASIASVIALAGNKVIIAENAMVMIHNPWTIAAGDAAEMRKQADTLDQVGETLITTYSSRTGKDRETVRAAMDAETWFTAKEAKEWGLVTDITEALPLAACISDEVVAALRFTRTPEPILAGPATTESSEKPRLALARQRNLKLIGKML